MDSHEQPTINDFISRLYTIRDAANRRATEKASAVVARNNARGDLKSGPTLRALADVIENEFDEAITAMLGALRHAKTLPGLDYATMREQTVNRRAKGTPDRRRTGTPLASWRTCMERATFALLAA
jgi:hypothetical protein